MLTDIRPWQVNIQMPKIQNKLKVIKKFTQQINNTNKFKKRHNY